MYHIYIGCRHLLKDCALPMICYITF